MDRGANATHMGDDLSPIDLGTGDDGNPLLATSVSVGDEFTCVLLEDSNVKVSTLARGRRGSAGPVVTLTYSTCNVCAQDSSFERRLTIELHPRELFFLRFRVMLS